MEKGELTLGQKRSSSVLTWEGYSYEDAVIMSERLMKGLIMYINHIDDDWLNDTKLGPENTREFKRWEDALKDADADGIIRIVTWS